MTHYHLEGLENEWVLVRETLYSQKFLVKESGGHKLSVDVHYTPPKILTVTIGFSGDPAVLTKVFLTPIMDDLSKLALRRGDYAVIDYTLVDGQSTSDGNFAIDKKLREVYQKT